MIEPFQVALSPEIFDDLRRRLRATRWPAGVSDSGGIVSAEMRDIAHYWAEKFDWFAQERAINRMPQFRVECDGLHLHCIHARSPRSDATPLLLLHGWPGSFVEMLPIAPLLSDAFHVVVPSLPGYGFSDAPSSAGMSNARIAELCAELMTALGYDRFLVQGGDIGAGVGMWLAARFPSRVTGLHLNFVPGSFAPFVEGAPTNEEAAFLRDRTQWSAERGAYAHLQRTRPLTLAYGLSDSPIGLAAWIVEKFREWADPRSAIPLDTVLTNATIYWATNTIASSMRVYLESTHTPLRFERGDHVGVPCGFARFPYEISAPPRSWLERVFNVVRWTDMPRGGHFAALEAPDLLAREIRAFAERIQARK